MQIIKVIIVLAVIVAIGGIFIPKDYSVSKELVINAPLNTVHQQVEEMDGWYRWTVWKEDTPPAGENPAQMESGIGSGAYFSGNAGSGWFIITSSSAIDGFEYTIISDSGDKAKAIITFSDVGGSTKVTWTISGIVEQPPVLAPYIALSKEFLVGASLSQNLKNLNNMFN